MITMVELLTQIKTTISELEKKEKENAKAIKALEEENEGVRANLVMYAKVLKDLEDIRNNELDKALNAPKKVEETKVRSRNKKKVNVIDEKGEIIATYDSVVDAAEDLKKPSEQPRSAYVRICKRIRTMSKEEQIEKDGIALLYDD